MDCGFIKSWRPYSFGGLRPKPHLTWAWTGLLKSKQLLEYTKTLLTPDNVACTNRLSLKDLRFSGD
ncbi:hypothetical protein HanRHA438_Chr04g0170741 [Helianthus annuus]|nr:hypothetical protein HanRHA438_Chr04g0170741 [Helianthus annuus]